MDAAPSSSLVERDPFRRFASTMDRVLEAGLPEPTAMALATAGTDGRPSVRMVLLKGFDEAGFVFFTNLDSRKGRELAETPFAALCFFWQPFELQHRLAKAGLGAMAGWWATVYFVTFHTEAGWDLVEPVTYLAGLTTIIGGKTQQTNDPFPNNTH